MKKEDLVIKLTWVDSKDCWFVALFDKDEIINDPQTGHPPMLLADDAETLWEHVERAVNSFK